MKGKLFEQIFVLFHFAKNLQKKNIAGYIICHARAVVFFILCILQCRKFVKKTTYILNLWSPELDLFSIGRGNDKLKIKDWKRILENKIWKIHFMGLSCSFFFTNLYNVQCTLYTLYVYIIYMYNTLFIAQGYICKHNI